MRLCTSEPISIPYRELAREEDRLLAQLTSPFSPEEPAPVRTHFHLYNIYTYQYCTESRLAWQHALACECTENCIHSHYTTSATIAT